ncbi:MAG TPA: hypothetical protein VFQ61_06965 [Polyangiaceae bacterium]|nr:hypothetical protein [Polyangiaceae bacterium]
MTVHSPFTRDPRDSSDHHAKDYREPSTRLAQSSPLEPRDRWLLTTALIPPAAWAVNLSLAYPLVQELARPEHKVFVYGLSVLSLVLTLGSGLVAYGIWSSTRREAAAAPEILAQSTPSDRSALDAPSSGSAPLRSSQTILAFAGMGLSVLFTLAIVAQIIPLLFFALQE